MKTLRPGGKDIRIMTFSIWSDRIEVAFLNDAWKSIDSFESFDIEDEQAIRVVANKFPVLLMKFRVGEMLGAFEKGKKSSEMRIKLCSMCRHNGQARDGPEISQLS